MRYVAWSTTTRFPRTTCTGPRPNFRSLPTTTSKGSTKQATRKRRKCWPSSALGQQPSPRPGRSILVTTTMAITASATENWSRPKREVRGLMSILSRVIKRETKHFHENGIRLLHIGRLDELNPKLRQEVLDAIELTKENDRMTVCIAFNYGGRAEIVEAVRRIVSEGIPPHRIDDDLLGHYLYTANVPDPCLIIRTAGEMRLSNFLLWQGAYAEFVSAPVCWPDFDVHDIDEALLAFSQRKRRFGGLLPEEVDYPSPTSGKNGARPNGRRPHGRDSIRP